MPPPTIRPARTDEYDEIARVWMNSWASTGLEAASNFLLAKLRARIPLEVGKGWSLFVADDGQALAAMLALHLPNLYLDQLFVAPEYQGQNLGRRLLAFTRQQLPNEISLRCVRENEKAWRWYEREGFVFEKEEVEPMTGFVMKYYRWKKEGSTADGGNRAALRAGANGYFHRRTEDARIPCDQSDGQGAGAEGRRGNARRGRRDLRLCRRALSRGEARTAIGRALARQISLLAVLRAWLHRARHGAGCNQDRDEFGGCGWGDAQRVFDVLDAALTKGPWILGETFSAADIAIGSGLNFAVRLFKMVPSRPSFDRYIDRCAARPAFQRASAIAAG
jgi:ribosomal protein S18 acetylase RimI-like enzyme